MLENRKSIDFELHVESAVVHMLFWASAFWDSLLLALLSAVISLHGFSALLLPAQLLCDFSSVGALTSNMKPGDYIAPHFAEYGVVTVFVFESLPGGREGTVVDLHRQIPTGSLATFF